MMELSLRDLVTHECVKDGLSDVISELNDIATQPRTAQSEENVGQFAVFLFETAKLAKHPDIRGYMNTAIGSILSADRTTLPSLNMKSRFKLEDAFKCVQ